MIERIEHAGELLALVMRADYQPEGISFITDADSPLQLGVLVHKEGYRIKPHIHKNLSTDINQIQEVLHIDSGKIEARFYDGQGTEIASTTVNCGDTILLVSGGHGFNILEDAKIIEVKQGPYRGVAEDKVRLQN